MMQVSYRYNLRSMFSKQQKRIYYILCCDFENIPLLYRHCNHTIVVLQHHYQKQPVPYFYYQVEYLILWQHRYVSPTSNRAIPPEQMKLWKCQAHD